MFDNNEKEQLVKLLEQFSQDTVALVSARAKLNAGRDDFNDGERAVIDFILAGLEYKGQAQQVLTLMGQVASIRQKLIPSVEAPKQTRTGGAEKKRARDKKPDPVQEKTA